MFENARIKLTLWYLLTIMVVSGFFSLIVYRGFVKELGRGFRYQAIQPIPEQRLLVQRYGGYTRILPLFIYPEEVPPDEFIEIIDLSKRRFALQLLIINGGILFLAGTAGHFLAGKTLHPIEIMVGEQKRFVADASHELRTPLTSIKTEVEVALRNNKLNLKNAKDILESNLSEVNKMKYFTDSLLELSRYESSEKDMIMDEVDLAEVAQRAIDKNRAQAKSKNIKIKENYFPEAVIKGNPQSLVELVSILVNNAVKYSPAKSQMDVNIRKDKKHTFLEVIDRGMGIKKDDIPGIFERFYRADCSRCKTQIEGYGLGLSIAKSIADLHGAEIKVESKVGKGSKFSVIFSS